MNDKEITKKVNLDCALKSKEEPVRKLRDILKLYNKDYLTDFYYVITKKEIDDTKQNIINKIYEELTDEDVIHRFLNTLIEEEYTELKRIMKNNGCIQDDYIEHRDYCYLKSFGIVHTFNYKKKLYVIIPEEILEIIYNININRCSNQIKENSKMVELAYAMLNLYGVVPLNIFLDYHDKYYRHKDNENKNLDCILLPERTNSIRGIETERNIYLAKNEYFYEDYDKSIIGKTISRLEDDLFTFDFKDIKLDDLLKYSDLFYYEETDAIITFKEYLKDNGMNDDDIDSLIGSLVQGFRKDYNESILFLNDDFEDSKYEINENNIEEILPYINDIINEIPMWGNKGWTNKEIILGKCYE